MRSLQLEVIEAGTHLPMMMSHPKEHVPLGYFEFEKTANPTTPSHKRPKGSPMSNIGVLTPNLKDKVPTNNTHLVFFLSVLSRVVLCIICSKVGTTCTVEQDPVAECHSHSREVSLVAFHSSALLVCSLLALGLIDFLNSLQECCALLNVLLWASGCSGSDGC